MKPRIFSILIVGLVVSVANGDEPPVISIRLSKPDQQLGEVIKLFDGARAPHPAAALAAWKRASKEPGRLGKPVEALVAAFNPMMASELRSLDEAEVVARFDEKTGGLVWGARLPKDDGTFAALAPALALSGGAAEGRLGDLDVDRLGPPGAPLMSRGPRGTMLGSDWEGLRMVTVLPDKPPGPIEKRGIEVAFEPGVLERSKSLNVRRVAAFLRRGEPAAMLSWFTATVEGSKFVARGVASYRAFGPILPAIEPGWLDWIPSDRAMIGFAQAVDPSAISWEELFDRIDRAERVDPARAGVAPARVRLDLLARSVGLQSEIDILPHLKGVSGWVGAGPKGVDTSFLAIHLDREGLAERLAATVRPLPGSPKGPAPQPGRPRTLGMIEGRPLEVSRSGKSVLLSWGEGALEASNLARDDAARSAGPTLRLGWGDPHEVSSAGGVWLGRIPGLLPEGSPLARAVAGSPPIRWETAWSPVGPFTTITLADLDATVRRFLDLIPLDPPTEP